MQSERRMCQNCKSDFTIEVDDFGFYEKIGVPPPMFCSECRQKRRLLWRNEKFFYKRECDLCRKHIISSYDVENSFPVYCQKCWWGDGWDPYSYGQDFDFSRPFFIQFKELMDRVPMLNMQNDDGIASLNCEYAQDFAFSKNCYLTSAGWYCDNVMYSYYTCYDKDVVDCFMVNNSERCYECFESDKLFDSKYANLCFESLNLDFCFDMRNCQHCFMCVGLRGKNYYIRNKPYTREAYFEELEKAKIGNRDNIEKYKKELANIVLKTPHRFTHLLKSPMCTGYMLVNSKMSEDSFWALGLENCKFMLNMDGAKDCYDITNSGNPTLSYDSVTPDNSYHSLFVIHCWKCSFNMYCNNCHSSNNIFGCIALKHAEYSILNKKYTKEQYEELLPKIIEHIKRTGEYGEFFPNFICPYAYNESLVQDFFPLDEKQIKEQGYRWKEEKERNYDIDIKKGDLPQSINEIDESSIGKTIECHNKGLSRRGCLQAFRIIDRELKFYKSMNIPVPLLCSNCRYYERLEKRNPLKLWHRKCMNDNCKNEFETPYAPERAELIYCEDCYNKEIY